METNEFNKLKELLNRLKKYKKIKYLLLTYSIIILSCNKGEFTIENTEKLIEIYYKNIIGREDVSSLTIKYSNLYNFDTSLLVALIKTESYYNPIATNKNRNGSIDRGLCQLNSRTFQDLKIEDFFNPEINIKNGARFLAWCIDKADNNLVIALAYYNAGFGAVNNSKVGPHTLKYINKIINEKDNFDDGLQTYLLENSDMDRR